MAIKASEYEMKKLRDFFDGGAHNWKCSFDEFVKIQCQYCDAKEDCIHKEAYRRVPVIDGGLGLCPNLNE